MLRLVSRITVLNLRVGETVVRQGGAANSVYFLRRGGLEVRHRAEVSGENRWPTAAVTVDKALGAGACGGVSSLEGLCTRELSDY